MVFSHRDRIEANNRRELRRDGWRQLFAEFDAVVCPITPTPAFRHDHNPNPLERRIDGDGVAVIVLNPFEYRIDRIVAGFPCFPAEAGNHEL